MKTPFKEINEKTLKMCSQKCEVDVKTLYENKSEYLGRYFKHDNVEGYLLDARRYARNGSYYVYFLDNENGVISCSYDLTLNKGKNSNFKLKKNQRIDTIEEFTMEELFNVQSSDFGEVMGEEVQAHFKVRS